MSDRDDFDAILFLSEMSLGFSAFLFMASIILAISIMMQDVSSLSIRKMIETIYLVTGAAAASAMALLAKKMFLDSMENLRDRAEDELDEEASADE